MNRILRRRSVFNDSVQPIRAAERSCDRGGAATTPGVKSVRQGQSWEERMADASERRKIVRAACPHDCPDTCAMLVTVEDGRAVDVRGDPEHPFTRGGLCVKVNNYEQRVYSPERLLHPLKRSGPKGSGQFERIAWHEAVEMIRDRWTGIIGNYGPTAILPYSYLGT